MSAQSLIIAVIAVIFNQILFILLKIAYFYRNKSKNGTISGISRSGQAT